MSEFKSAMSDYGALRKRREELFGPRPGAETAVADLPPPEPAPEPDRSYEDCCY